MSSFSLGSYKGIDTQYVCQQLGETFKGTLYGYASNDTSMSVYMNSV